MKEELEALQTLEEMGNYFGEYHEDSREQSNSAFTNFCQSNAKELIECLTKYVK